MPKLLKRLKQTSGICNWIFAPGWRKIPPLKRSLEERFPHRVREPMVTMPEVPKIVHDRLRAALPADAHPDADVLTAFAEQALSAIERENVTGHLARCGECRGVIALSLPALEAVAQPLAQ